MPDGLYVQYGCGHSAPDSWLNFDSSSTLRAERVPVLGLLVHKNAQRFPPDVRVGDVTRGLPVPDRSCAGVYASHVLEHLALDDFHRALDETFRILRPGGVFRAVVPDLEMLAAAYFDELRNGLAREAAGRFMRESRLGRERRARGLKGLVAAWLGNSDHLWMWDHPSLAAALAEHGFTGVRRAHFGDAADPAFRAVEDPGRFERAVAVEAVRPV